MHLAPYQMADAPILFAASAPRQLGYAVASGRAAELVLNRIRGGEPIAFPGEAGAMNEQRRIHESLELLGVRAQAAAIGMIQISIELNRAGVLDEAALGRIKDAIFGEISLSRPVSIAKDEYEQSARRRLDALFSGAETLRSAPLAAIVTPAEAG